MIPDYFLSTFFRRIHQLQSLDLFHCPNMSALLLPLGEDYAEDQCCINTVTFSGEKLLGIFPQHSVFSRDFPQQFNDQCYVICIGKHCQQNRNTRQFNQYTACRHYHCPRRQKRSATWMTKTRICPVDSKLKARGHSAVLSTSTRPVWVWQHRPHSLRRHVHRHRRSAQLLLEFRRNALVTMTAAPQLFHFCLHRGAFQREEVLPLRLKNSREYFPDRAKCLGILPSSSMMWAMWSMRREKKKDIGMGRAKGRMG